MARHQCYPSVGNDFKKDLMMFMGEEGNKMKEEKKRKRKKFQLS